MENQRTSVTLKNELTCAICTDILFQPLTLLDCLHTFCGSCLKEWFDWQAVAVQNSPNPQEASLTITCPSCREPVRDTKHNATVATLLEMFVMANPDKAKSEEDKEEMRKKYKPGDNVLPDLRPRELSPEEARLEEMERQMLAQAREMSLRDAGVDSSSERRRARRQRERSATGESGTRSERDTSRETRHRDARDRQRRAAAEDDRRQHTDSNNLLRPDASDAEERRRRRSGSNQRSRESSATRRRNIEHQASIRSLISSSDVDSQDMEREIEEFARQIQEEGLLEGLNLEDLDLSQNDDLSRKITEAYRRRQRERSRQESNRRSNNSAVSHTQSELSVPRPPTSGSSRSNGRPRANSANTRTTSSTSVTEGRSRPPISASHLEVFDDSHRRHRRRTSSGSRSATDPTRPSAPEARPAARSQTDLSLSRSQNQELQNHRQSFAESRSSSLPVASSSAQAEVSGAGNRDLPFSARAALQNTTASPVEAPSEVFSSKKIRRPRPPSEVVVSSSNPLPSLGLPPSPRHGQPSRSPPRTPYFHEPSITCAQCQRPHIEYDLHYNCGQCRNGDWNICLDCYRAGKGCLHWFGFGYAAFTKWERKRTMEDPSLAPPHMLTANRFLKPRSAPGGADGRRTLTTDDPTRRLQSGMFCARCLEWANDCFWRCDNCNEGDWGFCNNCVSQGRCCTHPLLPLTYGPQRPESSTTPPSSPRLPSLPPTATLLTGPNVLSIGNFKPLAFTNTCEICHTGMAPTQPRFHCYQCTSGLAPNTAPGSYEVCTECYNSLIDHGHISLENGPNGWRRCLKGHRMVLLSFHDLKGGLRRHVTRDLVGGWDLIVSAHETTNSADPAAGLQKWGWEQKLGPLPPGDGGEAPSDAARLERLVTQDVSATAPKAPEWTPEFPPDGGAGKRVYANWSWYPAADAQDELLFPKGAELREVQNENGDWYSGCYMGTIGLIPAVRVRALE